MADVQELGEPTGTTQESHASSEYPHIFILAYHFLPSPEVGARRATALAEHLRAKGCRVTVVSAFEGVNSLAPSDSRVSRLAAFRLEAVPDRGSAVMRRLVRMKQLISGVVWAPSRREKARSSSTGASPAQQKQSDRSSVHSALFSVIYTIDGKKGWTRQAARRLYRLLDRSPRSLIIVSAPPYSPVIGAISAGRRARVPVIVDLRDPIYIKAPGDGSFDRWYQSRTLRWMERYVMSTADAVVTTSPSVMARLESTYPRAARRIACIPNGFDGDPADVRTRTGHRLVMVYAGALYLNRNPFPLLTAIDHLLSQPNVAISHVEVVFAGACEEYQGVRMREWLATRRCGRVVEIKGHLAPAALRALYERATLLINLAEGQPVQVPAKTFELLALGCEVLTLCEDDSDTARLIADIPGVTCLSSADNPGLRSFLADAYRRHVVEGSLAAPALESIAPYARSKQNERFEALIRSIPARNCR